MVSCKWSQNYRKNKRNHSGEINNRITVGPTCNSCPFFTMFSYFSNVSVMYLILCFWGCRIQIWSCLQPIFDKSYVFLMILSLNHNICVTYGTLLRTGHCHFITFLSKIVKSYHYEIFNILDMQGKLMIEQKTNI